MLTGFEGYAGKVVDKAMDGATLKWIYATFCSFWALCSVSALLHFGTQDMAEGDGRVLALGGSPLRAAHTFLTSFKIPTEWIFDVDKYLSGDESRSSAFLIAIAILGVLSSQMLGSESEIGTVQGSSTWMATALGIQLGHPYWTVVTLIACVALRIRYRRTHQGVDAAATALLDFVFSALSAVLIPLFLLSGFKR